MPVAPTDPALARDRHHGRRRLWDLVAWGDGRVIGWPVALIVGWFAARIIPELFTRNRSATTVRVAALGSRSPLRDVTSTAMRWLAGGVVLTAVDVALSWWWGEPLRSEVPVAGSVVVAVCGSLAVVRIARRPQPAGSADDVAVDEAIRRIGTTGVLAAGLCCSTLPPGCSSRSRGTCPIPVGDG